MPLSKGKQALYPGGSLRSPEWLAVRAAILTRAGDACEECKVRNGATVYRFELGVFVYEADLFGTEMEAEDGHRVKIVLTIHHLDHDPANNDPSNLRALCQRCHLMLDGPHHRINRYWNRKGRLASGFLFDMEESP